MLDARRRTGSLSTLISGGEGPGSRLLRVAKGGAGRLVISMLVVQVTTVRTSLIRCEHRGKI